ncbi:MAG TPA: alpha/beta fold hydrolase [Ktedonosporobacter sp.]|nr:alpha/beta fold hydrolase [Ktedonosporobacter sp.]
MTQQREERRRDIGTEAAENILGPNPIVGLCGKDLFQTAGLLARQALRQPHLVLAHGFTFAAEAAHILGGTSRLAPDFRDRRFQDPTWKENAFYRRVLQLYLSANKELHDWVDATSLDSDGRKRAHFVLSLFTDALAPSNSPLHPEALKRVLETGGESAMNGLRHLLDDLRHNGGMPSQVDKSAFKVGENLATTSGTVVFRNEVLELIQYHPLTRKVCARPLLVVPPQINKFYVFDLSPKKSLVRYLLSIGVQTFTISWRNPTPAQRHWGLDTYVEAVEEALDVIRDITGSEDCNLLGACAGAMTAIALVGHLAAQRERKVNATTLLVSAFDTGSDPGLLGLFATEEAIEGARRHSHAQGVLDGKEMERVFAWLRPNDLVWNYWVNNYLLGQKPPAFDVLYWNSDSTRLPAKFHGDLLTLYQQNPLPVPGKLTVCGTPIDLSQVDGDFYAVAGVTDHIVPWQSSYHSSRLLGKCEFVLSNSGHIQSILNTPDNPKATFFINTERPASAQAWLEGATKQNGSWWEHWKAWLLARSGSQKATPASPGNSTYMPLIEAPGTYVYE